MLALFLERALRLTDRDRERERESGGLGSRAVEIPVLSSGCKACFFLAQVSCLLSLSSFSSQERTNILVNLWVEGECGKQIGEVQFLMQEYLTAPHLKSQGFRTFSRLYSSTLYCHFWTWSSSTCLWGGVDMFGLCEAINKGTWVVRLPFLWECFQCAQVGFKGDNSIGYLCLCATGDSFPSYC